METRSSRACDSPGSGVRDVLALLALAAGLRRHDVAVDHGVAHTVDRVAEERGEVLGASVRLLGRRVKALTTLQV